MLGNGPVWFGGGPHGKGVSLRKPPRRAAYPVDGAAQGSKKIARGNRWVIAGIVVRLPLCTAPVCLPVLMRLWAGKATTTPVELAAQLLGACQIFCGSSGQLYPFRYIDWLRC